MGVINNPINNSKGCGGVTRVAPAGLAFDKKRASVLGAEFAAIKNLGEGWIGEEALTIAVYCSLKHKKNFSKTLLPET